MNAEAVWRVGGPGDADRMRLVLMGLGSLCVGLLAWTLVSTLMAWGSKAVASGSLALILTTAVFSLVTHILVTLRLWARG